MAQPSPDNPTAPTLRIGRNPSPESSLPYLLRLPVSGERPIVLATRDTWPGPKDLFCYQLDDWPDEAEVVDEQPVQSCYRRGRAIHLVLERRQRRRSMFVWTRNKQGRRLIFWRTQQTMRGARPGIRVPRARGLDQPLAIVVDRRERYAWTFDKQRAELTERQLPAGDYGVLVDGRLVAAVERKRTADLVKNAVDGTLAMALAELAELPHSALVVEGRLSDALKHEHVDSGWLMSLIVALQTTHPRVTWTFAESRKLAQDYAFRWLAAARKAVLEGQELQVSERDDGQTSYLDALREDDDESSASDAPGVRIRDKAGRMAEGLRLAAEGRAWTSGDYADHFDVSQTTAWSDLTTLVDDGKLVAVGNKRTRRYLHPDAAEAAEEDDG